MKTFKTQISIAVQIKGRTSLRMKLLILIIAVLILVVVITNTLVCRIPVCWVMYRECIEIRKNLRVKFLSKIVCRF